MYYPTVTSECGMNFAPTKIDDVAGPAYVGDEPNRGRGA